MFWDVDAPGGGLRACWVGVVKGGCCWGEVGRVDVSSDWGSG